MNPAKKVLINPYTSDNYCSNMEVRLILVVEEHPWLLQYSQPVEDGNTHTHTHEITRQDIYKTIEQVTTQITIHAGGEQEHKTWTCSSNILQPAL